MGRALTATTLLAVTAALMSGCGGGSGSSTAAGSTTTNAKVPKHSHSIQINGDDAASKAFCKAKDAAGRRLQARALGREILASPNAPPNLQVRQLVRKLTGLCGNPAKRVSGG
jgi:hypothetical protein